MSAAAKVCGVCRRYKSRDAEWGTCLLTERNVHVRAPACDAYDDPLRQGGRDAGYEPLTRVLAQALDQAMNGKGRERHADGRPFVEQPMQSITAMVGLGFPLGQVCKKVQEASGMRRRGEVDAARVELLDAIVYLAGAVVAMDRAPQQAEAAPIPPEPGPDGGSDAPSGRSFSGSGWPPEPGEYATATGGEPRVHLSVPASWMAGWPWFRRMGEPPHHGSAGRK